jgi:hypothetical protein
MTFLLQEAEKKRQSQEACSSQSSAPKAVWDNTFVRAYNKTKGLNPTKRPHNGRVVGAGVGRKFKQYYGVETKEQRKERKKYEVAEAEALREKVAHMEETLDERIQDGVAKTLLHVLSAMQDEDQGRAPGSEGGSSNTTPPLLNKVISADILQRMIAAAQKANSSGEARQDPPAAGNKNDALVLREKPASSNTSACRGPDSPALIEAPTRRSPSISCTPVRGPTPLEELNALTVIIY